LRSEDKRFGGLSGLQISSDGQTMLAISDRGYWVGATLDYDGERLVGMRNVIVSPLLDRNGRPLNDKDKKEADAEAIAELPGSGIVVSFEGNNRLWHYGATLSDAIFGKRPHPLPLPVDIAARRLIITRSDLQRLRAFFARKQRVEKPTERLSGLMEAKERGRQRAEERGGAASTVGALRASREQRRPEAAPPVETPASAPSRAEPAYKTPAAKPPDASLAGQLLKKRKEREGKGD
ncbi:MAG: hypothetical protein DWB42_11235, partial [Chloroflexi bacterium]|nr:hypothetical protein [Chloroflexota bacterium]